MFAFALYDAGRDDWMIARDPIGIIPLYVGRRADGSLAVASEMKALTRICTHVEEFPPGHYRTKSDPEPVAYWRRDWFEFDNVPDREFDPAALREALSDAVHSHLMTDVPYGVLLSGGLDSSVVGAVASAFVARRVESQDREPAWWPRLHSFAIGLKGSPDLAAAQIAGDAIGTVHHAFEFTVQEGLDALRDVIWHIESFDITTVRASTPMYLMARRIRATGVKMVLSGEGSDEIFGGYLYFHKAPNPRRFTRRRFASCASSTFTIVSGPTSRWPLGASRPGSPFSIRSSWTWPWGSMHTTRWREEAGSRRRFSARHSEALCPRRSSCGRRSSSPTGSAIPGSTL